MKPIFKNFSVVALVFTLMMSSACQLDDTTISGVDILSYTTINGQASQIGAQEQSFTIDANQSQDISGEDGLELTIPANSFQSANGDEISGTIDLKLKEVLTKSDMVLSNKPSEANGVLLETVGSFNLAATQGGQAISINQEIGVQIDMDASISEPSALNVYYGNPSEGAVNWLLDTDSQVPLSSGVHNFDVDQLAWVSIAKPLESDTRHKLTINPGSLTLLNDQQGYLIFDDVNTVASLQQEGTQFVRDDFPEGMTATVVLIAIDPVVIYLSVIEGVNLTSDQTVNGVYNRVTEAELIATLEGLN